MKAALATFAACIPLAACGSGSGVENDPREAIAKGISQEVEAYGLSDDVRGCITDRMLEVPEEELDALAAGSPEQIRQRAAAAGQECFTTPGVEPIDSDATPEQLDAFRELVAPSFERGMVQGGLAAPLAACVVDEAFAVPDEEFIVFFNSLLQADGGELKETLADCRRAA